MALIERMEETEKSALWIMRCISALVIMRRQINKPFREATKDDIKSLFRWMTEEKHYKANTHEKFRMVLKVFYKTVYGDGEYYPEAVRWFSTAVGKEKRMSSMILDMAEFLEEDEVKKLVESASSLQKRAFVGCLYESGARPEEFLRLTNRDFKIDDNGAVLLLRGKTGERRVRIIAYVKELQLWLSIHPLRDQPVFSLWISEATNYKNQPLGIGGAEKLMRETLKRAGLYESKHPRLYLLRHSRATHLAKHLTEAQMCIFFGWQIGTKVIRRYVHLSGRDVDNALLSLNQRGQVRQEYVLKPIACIRCSENVSPSMKYCSKCALPVDTKEAYDIDLPIPSQNQADHNNTENRELDSLKEEIQNLKAMLATLTKNIN